jgi:PKD domain/Matrixin
MGRGAGALALALLAAAVLAAPASAYRIAGPRWPNQEISVANAAPRYALAVRQAIRAWNRADVGVRFTRAPTRRARVVFRYARSGGFGRYGCEGVAGAAGAGYPSPFVTATVRVIPRCREPALRRLTAMHELGHVLGLGHEERRCALMNPTGDVDTRLPSMCPFGTRVPTRDDVRGARSLYRGRPPRVSAAIGVFNPGHGSRLPFNGGVLRLSAAARNRALEYRWNFGEPASGADNRATGLDAIHTYAMPGVYTITLTVLDGGALIATTRNRVELY